MKDYEKEFVKCLHSIDYSKRPLSIFQDFLEVSAISLANVVYKSQELEKQYFEVIEKYKNPEKLAELLTITMLALEEKTQDFLGKVYMLENFGNKGTSQFFTPYHVSELMAELTMGTDFENSIKEKGIISVCEPCCGAGGMLIAASEVIKKRGYNPQQIMWFQGTDIDITCCRMAYIQTSLLGLCGEIIYGNTLTLEGWQRFITPMTLTNFRVLNKFYFKKPEPKEVTKPQIEQVKNTPEIVIKQLSLLN